MKRSFCLCELCPSVSLFVFVCGYISTYTYMFIEFLLPHFPINSNGVFFVIHLVCVNIVVFSTMKIHFFKLNEFLLIFLNRNLH